MKSDKVAVFSKEPKTVGVSITGKCNLHCEYCFYSNEMAGRNDLSAEEWTQFIHELGDLKVMNVSITGGEPFIRPDLFELIDVLISDRMRYDILSNGTLIDEEMLKKFEMGKRFIRLDSIQVSVDGSCDSIHNKSRPDSFDDMLKGLRLLLEADFPIKVRVTINRYNVSDLENIAGFLLEDLGIPYFTTNEAMPIGAGCTNRGSVSLTISDKIEAMKQMDILSKRYPGRVKAQAGPLAKLRMYDEMEQARKTGDKSQRWQMGYLTSCGCVYSKIDILHDGTVVPCCMMPGIKLGNIKRDSLADVWNHNLTLQSIRQRIFIPMQEVPGCEQCEWAPFCNGSCPGLAHQLTGDFNRANPEDCYRKYLSQRSKYHAV